MSPLAQIELSLFIFSVIIGTSAGLLSFLVLESLRQYIKKK